MTLPTDPKERKEFALFTFLTEYFPDAIEELVRISIAGNRQHNPGEKLHWSRGRSTDQLDTAFRHMWDHKLAGPLDTDGCYHLGKAAWRNLAELQLTIEAARAKSAPPKTISVEEAGYRVTNKSFYHWCKCTGRDELEALDIGDQIWYCSKCHGLTRVEFKR